MSKFSRYGKNTWKIRLVNVLTALFILCLVGTAGFFGYTKLYLPHQERTESSKQNAAQSIAVSELQSEHQTVTQTEAATETVMEKPKKYRHEYEAVVADVTWTEAKEQAEARGGHLVTITSEEEQRRVEEVIDQYSYLHTVWIGGNALSGSFRWINEEKFSYTNWGPGEPNNETGDEIYLDMYEINDIWYWNDVPNDITVYYKGKMGYVIEWEIEE